MIVFPIKRVAKRKGFKQYSIDVLVKVGYSCGDVEKRLPIPGMFITKDLFGFIDVIAIKPSVGIVGVQATSKNCLKDHVDKCASNEEIKKWMASGGHMMMLVWYKRVDGMYFDTWVAKLDGWEVVWQKYALGVLSP